MSIDRVYSIYNVHTLLKKYYTYYHLLKDTFALGKIPKKITKTH